ncbi:MAG: DUF4974 domain-containing protein [Muribaculaceae bacterium]|nr:DUF4974 domain-containing protein [Muribaculaceae bacterium]
MTDKIKHSLDFVVKFYRPGAFRPDGWFIDSNPSFWRRHAVAASVIGIALIAAAAAATFVVLHKDEAPTPAPTNVAAPSTDAPSTEIELPSVSEVKKIEFNDAPLPEVVKSIEATYNVKISGQTAGQPNLTLSYQGSAEDLVATINDLLGTNLSIEK